VTGHVRYDTRARAADRHVNDEHDDAVIADDARTDRASEALGWLRKLVPFVLLTAVALLLWRERDQFSFETLRTTTQSIPFVALIGLVGLGLFSVATMYAYDWVLARWQRIAIAPARLFHYSWVANSLSNSVGMSGLTGSSVRFMLLTRDGVPPERAAAYAGVQVLSIPLGLALLCGVALAARAIAPAGVPLPSPLANIVLACVAGYLVLFLLLTGDTALHRRFPSRVPSLPASVRVELVAVSFFEWLATAATFAACVYATGLHADLWLVLGAFALAASISLFSFIPGGLGVFDGTVVLLLAGGGVVPEAALTAVALYRVVYFLVPLIVGLRAGVRLLSIEDAALLSRLADRIAAHPILGTLRLPIGLLSSLGTRALAYLTFAAGAVLLISTASPAIAARAEVLHAVLPIVALESSHLLSTAAGVVLIAVARGIRARVRAAYTVAQLMLVGGAVFSLLKGIDYEESMLLLAVSALLWSSRGSFTREGYPLVSMRSLGWIVATLLAIAAYLAVGNALYGGDAGASLLPGVIDVQDRVRFARGALVVLLALLAYLGWSWYRMPGPALALPDAAQLERARRHYETTGATPFSHLTFSGDKYLFEAAGGAALIQFGVVRNRMVALGDPAGAREALEPAIREFREFAFQYNRVPVYYQVDEDHVHAYHDAGFALLKLGERGLVALDELSLRGAANADLRAALNRGARLGLEVALVEPPFADDAWSELQGVSRAWLADKGHDEKGFSLGRFTREYLERAPVAVVRSNGRAVAFASLMPGYGPEREISIDLMRHAPDAPHGTMDFLFVELMRHAQARGFRYFDLGVAPLAGVGESAWSRRDERLLRIVYELGSSHYHYRGLRRYKEKFSPHWRSVYLAWPHDRAVHPILIDLAVLVAGGYRRLLVHALAPARAAAAPDAAPARHAI
jgi:phosphatidylglycerol lysyltransferase